MCYDITFSFIAVCENPSGETCNINGVTNRCGPKNGNSCGSGSKSLCKPEYIGERCEMCNPQHNVYVFKGINGSIDNITSLGVQCKCKLNYLS